MMTTVESETGVTIHQVTQEERLGSNLYCERPFCSADSKRFLYARQIEPGGLNDRRHWEYVLCEFGTWEEQVFETPFSVKSHAGKIRMV